MNEPVRFALIGAGGIAQSYLQAFEGHPAAKLLAVVDPREDVARTAAARLQCSSHAQLSDLWNSGANLEAVVICTPPNTHETITRECLEHGLHIWCEKPFALTSPSAQRMIESAERAGCLLTMASKFRYVQDIIEAKRLIAEGVIGKVILFENAFTSRVDMSNRWNADPEISGGGVIIDNGTHSVDIMRYFLGPLKDIHAVEGIRAQVLQVEDTARLFVHSESGVMGSVDLSWSINKELDWYVSIYGTQGTLQVGWKQSRYRNEQSKEWIVFGQGYDKVQSFRAQLANFAGAIRGTEKLRITAQDALASVEVIESAYRSLQECPWRGIQPRPVEQFRTPLPVLLSALQRQG